MSSVFSERRAASTRREYVRRFACFQTWCEDSDECAMPASRETMLDYGRYLLTIGKGPETIRRYPNHDRHALRQTDC